MKENKFKLNFKIADRVHIYNCVVNSLSWAGFTQSEGSNWNIMWSAPLKPETLRNYDMYKHCNHFPGTWQLGRKDLMYRNIASYMREHGEDFNIVPKTWILPYDIGIFRKERDVLPNAQRICMILEYHARKAVLEEMLALELNVRRERRDLTANVLTHVQKVAKPYLTSG